MTEVSSKLYNSCRRVFIYIFCVTLCNYINKSQGQSFPYVSVCLTTPVFTHGRYVALS